MKLVALPEKTQKGEPNTVDITNKKIDPTSTDGKKFSIPANLFEYPQVESRAEFTQLCGTEERELIVLNEYLRDSAMAAAKNSIRVASTGTDDQIIAAGVQIGKTFTFVEQVQIAAGEAREKFAALRTLASADNMSDAELAAAVRALAGV